MEWILKQWWRGQRDTIIWADVMLWENTSILIYTCMSMSMPCSPLSGTCLSVSDPHFSYLCMTHNRLLLLMSHDSFMHWPCFQYVEYSFVLCSHVWKLPSFLQVLLCLLCRIVPCWYFGITVTICVESGHIFHQGNSQRGVLTGNGKGEDLVRIFRACSAAISSRILKILITLYSISQNWWCVMICDTPTTACD